MQVGVFMQVMNDDADRAVSAVTGLKLQMAGDAPVVLGGFEVGLDAYVGKLARAGHWWRWPSRTSPRNATCAR